MRVAEKKRNRRGTGGESGSKGGTEEESERNNILCIVNTSVSTPFPMFVIKYPEKKALQKGSVSFGLSWQRRHGSRSRWMAVTLLLECQWKVGPDCKTSRCVPKNLLPSTSLHFLKVWQFS